LRIGLLGAVGAISLDDVTIRKAASSRGAGEGQQPK